MVATIKFSQFQDGGTLTGDETVVGLESGLNTKFQTPALPVSFTPILSPSSGSFTTITYSTQTGYYYQSGKIVNFVINISLSAFDIGSGTNFLELTGYPWSFNNGIGVQTFSILYESLIGTSSYTNIVPFYSSGLGTMSFYLLNPNNSVGVVASPSLLSSTSTIYISGVAIVS